MSDLLSHLTQSERFWVCLLFLAGLVTFGIYVAATYRKDAQ